MRRLYAIYFLGLLFFGGANALANEKDFYITESLMPKEDEFNAILEHPSIKELIERRNFKRPSKCPIQNLSGSEIHEKLLLISKAFEYGECLNNNTTSELLKGLGSIAEKANLTFQTLNNEENSYETLSSLANITDLGTTTSTEESTDSGITSTGDYYSSAMNYLGQISESEDCVTNLKKQGFLSTLGSVITTIGQSALLVPSSSGFLFSAAGIGFGSALKVLANLFKSPFDWESSEERNQFQELNCSFFELRKEIETAHIFGVVPKIQKEQIDEIKKQVIVLEEFKKKLLEKQKEVNLKVLSQKKNYYKSKEKLKSYELYEKITSYLDKLEPEVKKEIPNQAFMVRITSDFSEELIALPGVSTLKYYPVLLKIFDLFDLDSVMESHALDYKIFLRKSINPALSYLNENKSLLDKTMLEAAKEFLALKKDEKKDTKTNKEIIKKIDGSYLSLLKKVGDTILYLNTQIEILTNNLKKKELDAYDDGSHLDYNITEEYLKTQESIYEDNGFPYIEYMRETAYDNIKSFKKKEKKFREYKKQIPIKKNLPWVCRTANQAVITWDFADKAVEVSWDFLKTNEGLFYQDVDRIKLIMNFLPVGRTNEYKLYKSARSAEIAAEVLKDNPSYHEYELEEYGFRTKKNLGKIILKVKRYKKKKDRIVDFMEKNKCFRYL